MNAITEFLFYYGIKICINLPSALIMGLELSTFDFETD